MDLPTPPIDSELGAADGARMSGVIGELGVIDATFACWSG